jgi:uncharacterized delta-60 repeat protein
LQPRAEHLEERALLSVGLDPTWGFGGVSALNLPPNTATNTYVQNYDAITQQNGQVVEVGTLTTSPTGGGTPTTNLIVSRLTTSGSIDTTFGSAGTGTATIPLTFGGVAYTVDSAADIAVKSNGSIDVLARATVTSSSTPEFLVVQLTAGGSIDTTFGTAGGAFISFGTTATPATETVANAMAIGPDGKIVAVGFTTISGNTVFAIARLTSTGALDMSFNTTGTTTVNFNVGGGSGESDTASAVAIQSNNAIVVAGTAALPSSGSTTPTHPSDVAIARLNANGTPDTSFNGNGLLAFNEDLGGTASADSASAVTLQGSQIVIAGTSQQLFTTSMTFNPSLSELLVARLNANGTFDTTFNTNGKFLLTLNQGGNAFDTGASSVIAESGGSLLVGGSASERNTFGGGPSVGLLLSLSTAGVPDSTFGTNGVALIPNAVTGRMFQQADGKVVSLSGGTVIRTTAPAPAVASTTIITTGTGKKAKASGVTITFNTAINPSLASTVTAYLVRPAKGKKGLKIRKKGGISYNAATQTLTINFATKTPVGKGFVLVVTPGAIVGADDQILSNNTIVIPVATT